MQASLNVFLKYGKGMDPGAFHKVVLSPKSPLF